MTVGPGDRREDVEAIVLVWLTAARNAPAFEAYLRTRSEVVDAWCVAADSDAVLRIRCADMRALDGLVTDLRDAAGGGRTVTHLVLRPYDIPRVRL